MPVSAVSPAVTVPPRTARETSDDLPDVPEMTFAEFVDKIGSISFGDVLDVINPLQHIPIVSTIYRAITGDEISNGARIAGGALYGGPMGIAMASAVATVETMSGESLEKQIATAFSGNDSATAAADAAPQIASAAPVIPQPSRVKLPLYSHVPSPARTPAGPASQVAAESGSPKPESAQAAENDRIARSVAAAQLAQASLLLASVSSDSKLSILGKEKESEQDQEAAAPQAGSGNSHPWKLPATASDAQIAQAMMQALQKYEKAVATGNAR